MISLDIVKKHQLGNDEIQKMKLFVKRNAEDSGFHEFFYWDSIEHRKERMTPLDWLCYVDGNIVAYVAIYYFSDNVIEANISLAKNVYQHSHDFFNQLYRELYNTFARYRLYATVFKVNFENKIITRTLADLGATVVGYSKYMQRDADASIFDRTELIIKIISNADNSNREAYIFYSGSNPVGEIHLLHDGDQVLIEDISVFPSMNDKNYQCEMLQEICNVTNASKSLLIEIDSDFEYLTKLYKKLNFYDVAIIHNYDKELKADYLN